MTRPSTVASVVSGPTQVTIDRWAPLALGLAVAFAGCGATAAEAKPRVLVVSEAAGFVHDSIPAAVAFFGALDGYDVRTVPSFAALTTRRLAGARVVLLANTSGEPRIPASNRAALLRFVRGGGGLVATHSSTDTFKRSWPAYGALVGARFDHHGPLGRQRLVVEDRVHPITRGLPARFTMVDEPYEFASNPRPRVHVLMRLAARPDRPLVWTRTPGKGRVFYSALGHPIAAWSDPRHERLLRRAVAWAARRA